GNPKPGGIAPVADVLPTGTALLNAFRLRATPGAEFVAKFIEIEVCATLKTIVNARLFRPDGPGSSRTFPVSVLKNVGVTANPPGSPELVNVASSPLTVSVNDVDLPVTSESKLNTTAARRVTAEVASRM